MLVELRPIASIQPYDNNPRRNDAAVDAVAMPIEADEVWAPVPGYQGLYEVSSHGRVRRASASRMAPAGYILKPRRTWDGYLKYSLSKQQRYWHVKAHRLVALAFLGQPPFPGVHVAHADGDKHNNHLANLRWATPKENEADKRRHGRVRGARPGEQHHQARLTVALVKEFRRQARSGRSLQAIASGHGIPLATTYQAIRGQTWASVTDPAPVVYYRGRAL